MAGDIFIFLLMIFLDVYGVLASCSLPLWDLGGFKEAHGLGCTLPRNAVGFPLLCSYFALSRKDSLVRTQPLISSHFSTII